MCLVSAGFFASFQCNQCANDCNLATHLQRHRRVSSSRVLDCSLNSPLERQFQGSSLTRNFLVSCLDGSNGLMTGNWLNLQDLCVSTSVQTAGVETSSMFLIVSDGQDSVFPDILTCLHTLRDVCSRILDSDCARHSATRDQQLLMAGRLSSSTPTSENEQSSCT